MRIALLSLGIMFLIILCTASFIPQDGEMIEEAQKALNTLVFPLGFGMALAFAQDVKELFGTYTIYKKK